MGAQPGTALWFIIGESDSGSSMCVISLKAVKVGQITAGERDNSHLSSVVIFVFTG